MFSFQFWCYKCKKKKKDTKYTECSILLKKLRSKWINIMQMEAITKSKNIKYQQIQKLFFFVVGWLMPLPNISIYWSMEFENTT